METHTRLLTSGTPHKYRVTRSPIGHSLLLSDPKENLPKRGVAISVFRFERDGIQHAIIWKNGKLDTAWVLDTIEKMDTFKWRLDDLISK